PVSAPGPGQPSGRVFSSDPSGRRSGDPSRVDELLERWRDDLESWAIPEEITSAVEESPWVLPREIFARRAEDRLEAPGGPSYDAAWEALSPSGSVLDVGAGVGAASLPLAPRATSITAVDVNDEMLEALAARAERLGTTAQLVR